MNRNKYSHTLTIRISVILLVFLRIQSIFYFPKNIEAIKQTCRPCEPGHVVPDVGAAYSRMCRHGQLPHLAPNVAQMSLPHHRQERYIHV